MAQPNRTAQLTRTHKVLKKHYKPVPPDMGRPVLEQALYGLLLENARWEAAETAHADLQKAFFDWNEVRVATVKELAELMPSLPDPMSAAANVRKLLQSVFDAHYAFELEGLRKLTLGQAQDKIQKLAGVTPFALAWVTQTALGGHAIPLDRGALEVLFIVGIANEENVAASSVPGMERAIPKNRGLEFGSLLHQLAAELVANPFSTNVHKVLLEIEPDCRARLPKRVAKKPEVAEAKPAESKAKGSRPAEKPAPAKKAAAKALPASRPAEKAHPPKPKSASSGVAKRKPR